MTLEELEIVVKADISDVTSKLNELKAQLQNKVNNVIAQTQPAVETLKNSVSTATKSVKSDVDIVNRQIELQAQKVAKLKEAYIEELKYAEAFNKAGNKNWVAPDVDTARAKFEQASIQLDKLNMRADKMKEKMAEAGKTASQSMQKTVKAVQKTSSHIGGLTKHIGRLIKMMIIRRIISQAIQGFNDLAKYSNSFNKSMSSMQSALLEARNSIATAFAPVVQALTPIIVALANAVTYLFTALAQVTTVLFTNNKTFTKAKKVTTDYAQSVGKANNQLAKFDELNVLSKDSGSAGLPSASEMFEEAEIDSRLLDLKEKIKKALNDISFNVDERINTIKSIIHGLWEDIKLVANTFYKSFLVPFVNTLVNHILPILIQLSAQATRTLGVLFNSINQVFQKIWKEAIEPIVTLIMQIWSEAWEVIHNIWNKYGVPIFEKLNEFIAKVGESLIKLWDVILKPIIDKLVEKVKWLWDNHLKNFFEKLLVYIAESMNTTLVWWNNVLLPFFNWFIETFGPGIKRTINVIITNASTILGAVIDIVSGVIEALTEINVFLSDVFTGSWDKAWKSIVNLVIIYINNMITGIETALNWIVDMINALEISKPFTGEEIWSPNVQKFKFGRIQKLAKGGVLTEPTPILAGEYAGASQNPEIVAPQKLLLETSTQANIPVMNAVEEMGDKLVSALNSLGVYAEFDYSKLKIGLDNENYRVGGKLYGI